jgi:Tol biopolymer transport system component
MVTGQSVDCIQHRTGGYLSDFRDLRRLTSGPSDNGLPGWSRDGRWIYFGSHRSGDWQIWKAPTQGGTAVQVTKKGGGEGFESFNGDFVYYAKDGSPGIWKAPVGGGNEIQVLEYGRPGSWALTAEGIYFAVINDAVEPTGVGGLSQQADAIKFYSFATGRSGTVREFSRDTKILRGFPTFSVSPDGQWIVYTQVDQTGSDLIFMENYR